MHAGLSAYASLAEVPCGGALAQLSAFMNDSSDAIICSDAVLARSAIVARR
jgi:hypothetical protein